MAKAIFFNVPAHGHINPTLSLVRELVAQGEDVVYYATREFQPQIEATGAQFRSYGPFDYNFSDSTANYAYLVVLLTQISLDIMPQLLADLHNDPFNYIIHDSICPWGRYIAQILNRPAICSTTTFAFNVNVMLPHLVQTTVSQIMSIGPGCLLTFAQASQRLNQTYGVTGRTPFDMLTNRADLNLVYTSRDFQPAVRSFDESYHFVGPLLCHRPDTAGFPWHELEGQSVLYVSLGTLVNERADFYRLCFEALTGLCDRVVMSIGNRVAWDALGPMPADFLVRRWVPQLDLLQRATAFVTHGGMNSVHEGLYFNVPLVVFPQTREQAIVGRQVQRHGVGLVINNHLPTADLLRRKTQRVLTEPSFKQAAQAIGNSLRTAGGVTEAVQTILNFRTQWQT